MKTRTIVWLLLGCVCVCLGIFQWWCNPRFTHAHNAIVVDATQFIKDLPPEQINGIFTTSATYSDEVDSIKYVTANGTLAIVNDRSPIYLVGRYNLATKQLLWIAIGAGPGDDKACGSIALAPPENALYVIGYFSDTARFSSSYNPRAVASVISHGRTDIVIAKYDYETGRQYWVNGGGGTGNDLGYMYSRSDSMFMHDESCMRCDSVGPLLRLWVRSWGDSVGFANAPDPADDRIIGADSTRFVKIVIDRSSGVVTELGNDSLMPR